LSGLDSIFRTHFLRSSTISLPLFEFDRISLTGFANKYCLKSAAITQDSGHYSAEYFMPNSMFLKIIDN